MYTKHWHEERRSVKEEPTPVVTPRTAERPQNGRRRSFLTLDLLTVVLSAATFGLVAWETLWKQ